MYNITTFEEKVNSMTKDKVKILKFNGIKKPVIFECLKCHRVMSVARGEFLTRKGRTYFCGDCHMSDTHTSKISKQKVLTAAKKTNKVLLQFIEPPEKASFQCKKCGSTFSRELPIFLKNQKCPICQEVPKSPPLSKIKKELKEMEDYCLIDEKQYKDLHSPVLVRHKCGFIWKVKLGKLLDERSRCPKCSKKMPKGEKAIRIYLDKKNVFYIPQWEQIINGHNFFFDFYIPRDKIAIEFQGEFHFHPVDWLGGEKGFLLRQRHDNIKRNWCKKNNIILLEISYCDFNRIEEILEAQRLTVVSSGTKRQISLEDNDIV